jgi:transcriptional regulator with XRE-family HTH domain
LYQYREVPVKRIPSGSSMITRVQIRMARAALGWGVRDLANRAGVSPNTVSRFENGAGARVDTLGLIQYALERAGIMFVPADEAGGPGVRLKPPTQAADKGLRPK